MKLMGILSTVVLLLIASPGRADEGTKNAKIEEMMQLTHVDRTITQVLDQMGTMLKKPAYVKLYAETFTESEIEGILAFDKSPAGRAMIEKTPELMQKSIALSQQLMGNVMPDIERMVQELQDTPVKKP